MEFLGHVLVVELLAERRFSLRQFSEQLREQIDDWGERSSEKSVLYREWIRGAKAHSKAVELFGSLQLSPESKTDPDEWCRRKAYLGVLRAIILRERSRDWPWRKSHGVGKSSLWPALRRRGGMTGFGC
jgi:hypothetical protein